MTTVDNLDLRGEKEKINTPVTKHRPNLSTNDYLLKKEEGFF